jgi:hypothetical protein
MQEWMSGSCIHVQQPDGLARVLGYRYVCSSYVRRASNITPIFTGWQTFASKYRDEILQTFARMHAMRDKLLPENRNYADYYLRNTWHTASVLAKSLQPPAVAISDQARERFEEYVKYEEDRMRKSLAGIKYDIDALETVYGVLGPGRIEKVSGLPMCDIHCSDAIQCSIFLP